MTYAIDDVAAIQDKVLDELHTGRSLRQVCQDDGMPDVKTIGRWLIADAAFALRYAQARMAQANGLFDRMEAVEESVSAGTIDSHAARVILDSMRWRASKLAPKVYGDRLDVSVTETKISITAALQAAQGRMSDTITIDASPGPAMAAPKPLHIPDAHKMHEDATDVHTKEIAFVHDATDVHKMQQLHVHDAIEVQEVQHTTKAKAPWPRPKPAHEPLPVAKPKPAGASAKLAALQARLDAISSR